MQQKFKRSRDCAEYILTHVCENEQVCPTFVQNYPILTFVRIACIYLYICILCFSAHYMNTL